MGECGLRSGSAVLDTHSMLQGLDQFPEVKCPLKARQLSWQCHNMAEGWLYFLGCAQMTLPPKWT